MSPLDRPVRTWRKPQLNGSGRSARRVLLAALVSAGALLLQTATSAAPGDLDPGFGAGGMAVTNIGTGAQAYGAAIQTDGKVVVAGYVESATTRLGSFVVARYTSAGALDPSFGTAGKTVTAFGKDGRAFGMVLQADGRIVAAGYTQANNGKKSFALARYGTDGHADKTFGSGGKSTTTWGAGGEVQAVALTPDGKIVAAGWSVMTGSQQFALARYKSNGRIDTTFGKSGRVSSILGRSSAIQGVVVQSDGKIVTAGYVSEAGNVVHFAVARFLVNGSPDPSFGTNGVVITDLGGRDLARAVALQADGKIVAAGQTVTNHSSFAVIRYDTDGHTDSSFGNGGIAITDIGSSAVAFAVAVLPGGNIVAAGFNYPPGSFTGNFALASYTQNGNPDLSFGTGGTVSTSFGSYAVALAIAFHGSVNPTIVAAGFAGADGNGGQFALARYLGN